MLCGQRKADSEWSGSELEHGLHRSLDSQSSRPLRRLQLFSLLTNSSGGDGPTVTLHIYDDEGGGLWTEGCIVWIVVGSGGNLSAMVPSAHLS